MKRSVGLPWALARLAGLGPGLDRLIDWIDLIDALDLLHRQAVVLAGLPDMADVPDVADVAALWQDRNELEHRSIRSGQDWGQRTGWQSLWRRLSD